MARRRANLLSHPTVLPVHIQVPETTHVYGYDPRYLKPSSERLVVTDCAQCGKRRDVPYRRALRQRTCLACSNATNARSEPSRRKRSQALTARYAAGHPHPRQGTTHTPETRHALSRYHTGKPKTLTEETRQALRERCRTVLHAPAVQQKARPVSAQRRGPLNHRYGKRPSYRMRFRYTDGQGRAHVFRSSWEALFAWWSDQQGRPWMYEPRVFSIRYVLDGVVREGTYTPDFFSDGTWFEIKGRWTPEALAKVKAFQAQYPDEPFTLVTRDWFRETGLLSLDANQLPFQRESK